MMSKTLRHAPLLLLLLVLHILNNVVRSDAPACFVAVPRPGLRMCSIWPGAGTGRCIVRPGFRDDC